jgi:hypothetical protein
MSNDKSRIRSGSAVIDPEVLHKDVDDMYLKAVFGVDDENAPVVVLGAFSEQHYLLALAALETARAHFALAHTFTLRKD